MWTDDRVSTLKSLWTEGLSATEIARVLGDGVTRNAVIGKVHRIGLAGEGPRRSHNPRPRQSIRLRLVEPPRPRIIAPDPVTLADGSHIGVLTVSDRTCRFPIGDPAEESFHFCGHTPHRGAPYCEAHVQHTHVPTTKPGLRQIDRQARYYERGAVARVIPVDIEPEIAA